jgi:hypothetical protein
MWFDFTHINCGWKRGSRSTLVGTTLHCRVNMGYVATHITSQFNLSFVLTKIPKDWKAAVGIPFIKGTDTLDPNCYRPISILPCLSKVFKSKVNKQVTEHLESHRTFSAVQSGFRADHGCTSPY